MAFVTTCIGLDAFEFDKFEMDCHDICNNLYYWLDAFGFDKFEMGFLCICNNFHIFDWVNVNKYLALAIIWTDMFCWAYLYSMMFWMASHPFKC